MKNTRRSLLTSAICLLLCFSMLLGTTFAWFTDFAASEDNVVKSGELNAEMYWSESYLPADSDEWQNADGKPIFTYDNWEPGYTDIKYIKVENAGDLAFKWRLTIEAADEMTELADVIDVYYVNPVDATLTALDGKVSSGSLRAVVNSRIATSGVLLPEGETSTYTAGATVLAIALHMDKDAGNKYQGMSVGDGFSINLIATQFDYEEDSFGSGYDTDAEWPTHVIVGTTTLTASVTRAADGTAAEAVNFTSPDGAVRATVPAGAKLAPGVDSLTLVIKDVATPEANIILSETEVATSVDVHVFGLAADNDVPTVVEVDGLLPAGLNMGNYDFYHVENGETNKMTLLPAGSASVHNGYEYDPATGDAALHLATFSEIALVADTENAWNGTVATAFAGGTGTETDPYLIANADQFVYFGDLISNENATYGSAYYKLLSDINLGGEDNANNGIIFYPIGYHAVGGTVALADLDSDAPEFLYFEEDPDYAQGTASVISEGETTVNWYTYGGSLQGTFDGDGHTISNVYQNTWQLKGNYDGNYWNSAMGIFGYVNGGTVKNLTVDNFSSDGEFTPTGVIAAYARDAAFENIAITNCNPRVYNTGNGGIVGIGGHSTADTDADGISFTNVTIDNTNKISALWGSWDVACGGLIGMFRGAGHVYMTNCHVAAQIDVYNDVCGNYQYYWYRYSGMMVGTNKNMITDANGYTVPETSKFHATDCTVHFGTWNNYYYCELVANSLASYTHDHQFSRLTEVDAVDVENMTYTVGGNIFDIPTSGRQNYVVVNGEPSTENATCYHFVNGAVWNHEDAGYETVNGETILKEDRQHYYLPFNQLFTGYGWGVKHIPVYNGEDYAFAGITILDRETADSVTKFESDTTTLFNNKEYTLGDIFTLVNNEVKLIPEALTVTITNTDNENRPVSVTFTRNSDNWENGTLLFSGTGEITITIQDYYFCTPTTITVDIVERVDVEKFDVVFNNGDFLHRVGNSGPVSLGTLFGADNDTILDDGMSAGSTIADANVEVSVESISGASGAVIENTTDWTKGTIQFGGTGVVKVTITDNDYCTPTELTLEVVDAVNATTATNATSNNVVLLKDVGFSSLEVSGGYTLFGNGFTMTCSSDSYAADLGYAFVTLSDGTLDNVQIVCPNFDYAALYKSNLTSSDNRSYTTDAGKTYYYNARSGVMASGNSQILNSRISGARAAVNITSGNVVIDDSRIEGGAVASLLVGAANSVILRDVTLVQKPTESTYIAEGAESGTTLMGFSVLIVCNSDGDGAPITIEGELIQNAWVDENDSQYVPSAGQSIISSVLSNEAYTHDLDGDGTRESLNLGFAYMPESTTSAVNATTITDNRTNKSSIPYDYATVSILNGSTYVYSYKYAENESILEEFTDTDDFVPGEQGANIGVIYFDTTEGLTTGKSYGTNGWVYELSVDLDTASGYALDFSKLTMTVNGVPVTDYLVDGSDKPTSSVTVVAGGVTYTLTITFDDVEYTALFKVTGTETTKESPSLVASNYEAALLVGEAGSKYGNKDTWHGAAPVLNGIQIKYWSVAEKQYKTITLSDYTPTTAGKQNGTNAEWTYSPDNGDFTLTIKNETAVHSSNAVYAMPVVCNSKLYFVASSSNGLVNYGNSARTVIINYYFKDNNGGDELKFSYTWSIECADGNTCYDYSDFCSGTSNTFTISSSNGCFAEGTMITLADGTQKPIEQITYEDQLLAWDFNTGTYAVTVPSLIEAHEAGEYRVINLNFADGTVVRVIVDHGFFDVEENNFVYIDENNVASYVGHSFVKTTADGNYEQVELVGYEVTVEKVSYYTIQTAIYNNCIAEGMFTLTSPSEMLNTDEWFDYFEIGEGMKYDEAKKQADIEKYGLYTYDDFAEYVTYEQFIAFNGPYLKVLVGRGVVTFDEIIALISIYVNP